MWFLEYIFEFLNWKCAYQWSRGYRGTQRVQKKVQNALLWHLKPPKIIEVNNRWVSVVGFHDPTLGIGKVFGQESTVVKWNCQILSLHLVTVCQKVPILDFQSEVSMSKFIEEYQFRRTFFVKSIFCWLQFLNHFITKMTPNFWRTATGWRPKIW